MERKLRVGLLFGGRSSEHEVSLASAASVLQAIDHKKYEVIPIGISQSGEWLVGDDPLALLQEKKTVAADSAAQRVFFSPVPGQADLIPLDKGPDSRVTAVAGQLDVIFPVLHGTYGEDGTIQGLLELANIPYVGAGVAASAVGMDKAMAKAIFTAAGLPQLPYLVVLRSQWEADPALVQRQVEVHFGYPCFVKPAGLGSSVGISKVHNAPELQPALEEAAAYDRKLVIEKAAENVREVECSVLGNDRPIASVPGEIIPSREFYDYVAKYRDENSRLIIPARISARTTERVQQLALAAFRAVDCAGMARVDFFVDKESEEIYLNEINTIPGFTPISMYPKLWEASGISYGELIDRLIQLALERHNDKQRNRIKYTPSGEGENIS